MVKNLVCGAVVACLLAVNVASAQNCGCSTPAPSSCGCNACQSTCCDPCCNPLGTALKNIGCGVKNGLCHIKGGISRLLCPIRYDGCSSCNTGCNSGCSSHGCGNSRGGGCTSCGSGVPSAMHYGSPVIEASPTWNGGSVPTAPTSRIDDATSVTPEPARFQPPGDWKSAQAGQPSPAKSRLYYSKVIADKAPVSRVSHTAHNPGAYYAAPQR